MIVAPGATPNSCLSPRKRRTDCERTSVASPTWLSWEKEPGEPDEPALASRSRPQHLQRGHLAGQGAVAPGTGDVPADELPAGALPREGGLRRGLAGARPGRPRPGAQVHPPGNARRRPG